MRMSALTRDPEPVILVDPRLVSAAGHVAPPIFLVEVPANGLAQSGLEPDAASIAEFGREFRGVYRITVIVARPVGHVGDERAAARPGRRRTGWKALGEAFIGGERAVDRVADQPDHVEGVAFVAAAQIVGFPDATPLDHAHQ